MCLDRCLSDRFQWIRCQLPHLEADHLGDSGRHLAGQSNNFAHEERPRARDRVKSTGPFDLRYPAALPLFFQTFYNLVRSLHEWLPDRAGNIQDRISIFRHTSAFFKISGPNPVLLGYQDGVARKLLTGFAIATVQRPQWLLSKLRNETGLNNHSSACGSAFQ
jgi:hypothetical protein